MNISCHVTPQNAAAAAAAGSSVAPPPPIIGSRRAAAAAEHKHSARRRRQNSVGLGLYFSKSLQITNKSLLLANGTVQSN